MLNNRKHGHTAGGDKWSPTYMSWASMRSRVKAKHWYSDRGIKVCDRWSDFRSFLADVGERPLGPTKFSLERIDNNGDYEPGNCRWATQIEQTNNKRGNRFIEVNGDRLTVAQASKKYGIKAGTICYRLDSGWSAADAATVPIIAPTERSKSDRGSGGGGRSALLSQQRRI